MSIRTIKMNLPRQATAVITKLFYKAVSGKQKAVVAFITGFVVTQLAHRGLTVDMSVQQAIGNVVAGVFAHLLVYLTPNRD